MWDEKVEKYQVAWYDMERNGSCFDEYVYSPEDVSEVIEHVETAKNENKLTRTRVFFFLNDGEQYELKLEKIENGRRCNKFYN